MSGAREQVRELTDEMLEQRREALRLLVAELIEGVEEVKAYRANPDPERLYHLLVWLVEKIGWSLMDARNFLNLGIIPAAPPLIDCEIRESPVAPALDRLVLTLDPNVPTKRVAELVNEARKNYWTFHKRSLSTKHIVLAGFTARPFDTWRERMAAWNSEHPEWAYQEERIFARDALQARSRVLGYHRPLTLAQLQQDEQQRLAALSAVLKAEISEREREEAGNE